MPNNNTNNLVDLLCDAIERKSKTLNLLLSTKILSMSQSGVLNILSKVSDKSGESLKLNKIRNRIVDEKR